MVGTGTKSEIRNCHRLLEKQAIKHELTRKHVLCYGRRMHTAVGRIMSPTLHQRWARSNAQNLYVTLHGRRGIKIAGEIKVTHQLTLKYGHYLRPKVIARVLKSGRGSQKRRVRERYVAMEITL